MAKKTDGFLRNHIGAASRPSKPPSKPIPIPGILRPEVDPYCGPPSPPSLKDTPFELIEKLYDEYLNNASTIKVLEDDLGDIKVDVKDLLEWKLRHEGLHIDITTSRENRLKYFKDSFKNEIESNLRVLTRQIDSLNNQVAELEKDKQKVNINYCTRCKWFEDSHGCLKTNPVDYPHCFEEIKRNCLGCRQYAHCPEKVHRPTNITNCFMPKFDIFKESDKIKEDIEKIKQHDESLDKTVNNWIANLKGVRGRVEALENKIMLESCIASDCKYYSCNLAINRRRNCYQTSPKKELVVCGDCNYLITEVPFHCWRKNQGKREEIRLRESTACSLGELK